MERPFSAGEVRRAAFQIGDTKAPGPDGFSGCFFKDHWDIVGSSVTSAVLSFLNSGRMLTQINYTHIVLIPKVQSPRSPSDFSTY